jgi:hypothetical protein
VNSAAANTTSIGNCERGNVVFLAGRAGHNHFGTKLSDWKLIHGGENLLLDLPCDVMFDGHVQMTIMPQLPHLFLKREQDPMQRFLKGNHGHGAVQTLLKDHPIEGIQTRQQFLQEPTECILDE